MFRLHANNHVRPLSSSRSLLCFAETRRRSKKLCFPISFVFRMTRLEPFSALASLLIASLSFVSQRSSVSWKRGSEEPCNKLLTGRWIRGRRRKTVEMDLRMLPVISFNIIKSFYSFRSSRGASARDDEHCWEGFTQSRSAKRADCHRHCCRRCGGHAAAAAKQDHLTSLICLQLPQKMCWHLWKTGKLNFAQFNAKSRWEWCIYSEM